MEEESQRHETDRISRFMFGEKGVKNTALDDELTNEHDDSTLDKEHIEPIARERDWLFGHRYTQDTKRHDNLSPQASNKTIHSLGNMLQNVDYIELMQHVDTLMTSASELKPLLKKIKPVIESFLNSNK